MTQKPLAEIRRTRTPNVVCETCGEGFFKHPCHMKRTKQSFCSKECMDIFTGGGKLLRCEICGKEVWRRRSKIKRNAHTYCSNECYVKSFKKTEETAKNMLSNRSYRRWRAALLKGASCILCDTRNNLELHHIESRQDCPEKVRDESNVCPMCATCHDIFHSNSSKGEELRGTLNAILAHGNPQPSRSNVVDLVERKVQRLTGEETTTNKPDTRIAPERDDIVRAYGKP